MFLCIFLWQTCVTCTFPWMRRFSVCSVKTPTFFFSSYKTNRLNEGSNVISQKRRGNQQKKIYTEQCFWNEVHMPYFSYFWAHRKTTKNWEAILAPSPSNRFVYFLFLIAELPNSLMNLLKRKEGLQLSIL